MIIILHLDYKQNSVILLKNIIMGIEIKSTNELAYGNLPQHLLRYVEEKNEFTKLVDSFTKFPFPDVEETYEEVNQLINIHKSFSEKPDFGKTLNITYSVDSNFNYLFVKECKKLELFFPIDKFIEFQEKIAALIVQLKMYYQRPRPFQFAFYTDQKLNPFESATAQSPSYPSGHTIQATTTAIILSEMYPEHQDKFMKIANKVSFTRMLLGVHYKSDIEFGELIVEALTKHEVFKNIIDSFIAINKQEQDIKLPK